MSEKTILEEAAAIVDGARQSAYGHPRENHGTTGSFWTDYLKRRGLLAPGAALDAHDVCMLNILQKVSREANSRQRDTLVDIAGFARNAEMVDEPEPPAWDWQDEATWPIARETLTKIKRGIVDEYVATYTLPDSVALSPSLLRIPIEPTSIDSLWGFPLVIDENLPSGRVELRKRSAGSFGALGFWEVVGWTIE